MTGAILLDGHTMNRKAALKPLSMGIRWTIDGLSSATMTLDQDSTKLTLKDWVLVTAPNGDSGVFYVKNMKENTPQGTINVTLEHGFGLLQEMIVFGETKPEDMGGSETEVGLETAIRYMLGKQTENIWTLGGTDYGSEKQGWKFTHSTIYAALTGMTGAVADCQWEFDQTSLPWKLYLKRIPTDTTMEMRMNRNIESIKMTVDRSRMFTRVYPTGKNDLHITGEYLERNTAEYGIISQVITDNSISSESLLRAWAQKELKRNSEPNVSVSISGADLSQATGESLDKITIGRQCRVPLPEYGTTVTERVVEISWRDAIADEETVTVTLANQLTTIQGVLYEIATGTGSSAARSGGGGGSGSREHDCELGDVEEHIEEYDNSDIWINRDSVWAVSGSYQVYYDAEGNKVLRVKDGAALEVERDGVYETVGTSQQIQKVDDTVTNTIMGSALWTQREQITGVCGEYDVVEEWYIDPETGERKVRKTLVVKSGGGMKIRRDGAEYGVYDDGSLTGGIITTKLADGTVKTLIAGDIIQVGGTQAQPVKLTADLQSKADEISSQGNRIVTMENLFANKIWTNDITADYIKGKLADVFTFNAGSITVSGNINASGVIADGLYIKGSGGNKSVANAVETLIHEASYDTNGQVGLKYRKLDGTEAYVYFDKVASIAGNWSGAIFTASKSASGQATVSTEIVMYMDGTTASDHCTVAAYHDSKSDNNLVATKVVQLTLDESAKKVYAREGGADGTPYAAIDVSAVYDAGNANRGSDVGSVEDTSDGTASKELSSYNTKYKIQTRYKKADGSWANGSSYIVLTPADRYSTGYDNGKPTSASLGSKTSKTGGIYYNVLVNKGDGGQVAMEVDMSAAYSDARSGYTLGKFSQAAVTLQGGQESCYVAVSSGGTNYYKAGTKTTYYKSGESYSYYKGDGSYVYGRGTGQKCLTGYKDKGTERHYDVNGKLIGNFHWYYGGTEKTMYPGDGTKGYLRGNTVSGTNQGESVDVTPISGSALMLASTIRYKAGTKYSASDSPYYTKS